MVFKEASKPLDKTHIIDAISQQGGCTGYYTKDNCIRIPTGGIVSYTCTCEIKCGAV